jgi:hypothetical protein
VILASDDGTCVGPEISPLIWPQHQSVPSCWMPHVWTPLAIAACLPMRPLACPTCGAAIRVAGGSSDE